MSVTERRLSKPSETGDELRPVSALFADVVGSTGLGERLTPAEVKALIGECVTRMSRVVERFGGVVQAYAGDGLCAYFGVPSAHEDDPERAALAGLGIRDIVADYARDVETAWGISDFAVRVGINTGRAAVGSVGVGEGSTVALGDVTNVAARLQTAAEPGTITVGGETAKRLRRDFDLEPLGQLEIRGRRQKVEAWRLLAARATAAEAARGALIGRRAELERLRTVRADLLAGRGQVLCVLGDAGIGKTRLLEELRAEAGAEVTWLSSRCSPHGIDGSYAPFADFVRSWLNLDRDAPGIAVRTRLHARADSALGAHAARLVEPLERLLATDAAGAISAGALRAAFADLVDALSAERPLVLVLDDLHWADTGTRALAEDLLAKTDETAVLIAAAFRPDRASEAWKFRLRALSDFGHRLTELEVAPLDRADAEALAVESAGGALDESSARLVAERAEGNPLFVEQLLAELVDSGALQRRRTWTVTASADELPPALESLLLARLDRLSPSARSVLRVAAVVGRTSPRRVLEQVEGRSLDGELTELLRGGVLREARRYPEPEFGFEHGLVQELELGTFPPARRRELYARVARAFEELYGEALDRHLERLAHYYSRSDEPEKALGYLERAGARARELGMDDQAAELWRRGWRLATRIGDRDAARRLNGHLAALTR